MEKAEQLIDEIRQITEQYRNEVSTNRRTWPASIRERVIELKRLGLSPGEILLKTGVPKPTIWVWTSNRAKGGDSSPAEFIPVRVKSTVKRLTVKSAPVESESKDVSEPMSRFTVELPGGLRVRDIDLETLIHLSRRLS